MEPFTLSPYARSRLSGLKVATLGGVAVLIVLVTSLVIFSRGPVLVALTIGYVILGPFGLPPLLAWNDLRRERRRRATGEEPGWRAEVAQTTFRREGHRSGQVNQRGQALPGRLQLNTDRWHWDPSPAAVGRGAKPLEWPRSAFRSVQSTWGTGGQGLLILQGTDDMITEVWVRHPGDVQRAVSDG